MIRKASHTKKALAGALGISRATIYYVSRQLPKDWNVKGHIEEVLSQNPSYGYRRVALALHTNKKRIQRVMRLFSMAAYRRRGKKPKKIGFATTFFPNLLKTTIPSYPNHIWVADFTYVPYQGKFIFLATTMDIFTREIVGYAVMTNHTVMLVLEALFSALQHHPRPLIFHSDNGREYGSRVFIQALHELGIHISRSTKSSPWENGYQESFYSQFKIDLGDSNRFKTLGELVYTIHHLLWEYNHTRIHSVLKMPPLVFAQRLLPLVEKVS